MSLAEMKRATTILMAEDDEGHALLIQRALKKVGFHHEIVRFRDGQELLDFFEREDLLFSDDHCAGVIVLLDIRMPKVDGIEVLEKIKRTKGLKELPVIMLTTTSNPEEIERCYQLGCNSYMVKPVQHQEFSESIQTLGDFIQKSEFPSAQRPSVMD